MLICRSKGLTHAVTAEAERMLGLGKLPKKKKCEESIAIISMSRTSVEYIKHIRRVGFYVELLRERKSRFVEYS